MFELESFFFFDGADTVQFSTVPNTPCDLASLIYRLYETPEGRKPKLTGSRNQRGPLGIKLA